MSEKTWDMVYDAIINLTKAVNDLRTEMHTEINDLRNEMNIRFDRMESDTDFVKLKLFDTEKELSNLKRRA